MTKPAQADYYEIKMILSSTLQPEGCSVVSWLADGTYRVAALARGPFDTPQELLAAALAQVDIQLSLWDNAGSTS